MVNGHNRSWRDLLTARRGLLIAVTVVVTCLLLFVACEYLFDITPPKVRFVLPVDGDTVYSPVVIEIEATDEHFSSLELFVNDSRVKTYDHSRVQDTLRLTAGAHIIAARARDRGGNWREVAIGVLALVLVAPEPSAPGNGSVLADSMPMFGWNHTGRADEFQLQVDNNSDFSTPEIDLLQINSYYRPTVPLAQGGHYWRVRARVAPAVWSGWSAVWSFAVAREGIPPPALHQPADGDTIGDDTPRFDWGDVSGVDRYWLMVDDDPFFLSPAVSDSTLAESGYTPGQGLSDGRYHWRVRTKGISGHWSGWSVVWSFVLSRQGLPSLVRPADGAVLTDNRPEFSWTAPSGAVRYRLQVDDDPDFATPVVDESLAVTTYTPTSGLADGEYYWRVRARNAAGVWSGWTGAWSFSIRVPVLDVGCAAILAPAGTVDSGRVVAPACSVRNYGDQAVSYQVRMHIGSQYDQTEQVTDQAPGSTRYVIFPVWTAEQVGIHPVSCSTELVGDMNPGNDRRTGSVTTRRPVLYDVGCTGILAPTGMLDTGAIVTPACSVFNYGLQTVSYTVRMRIGDSYNFAVNARDHEPRSYRRINFPDWAVNQRGTLAVSCSTELSGDVDPSNDRETGSVDVRVLNVACINIVAPVGEIDSGTAVSPSCVVSNPGNRAATYTVRMKIGGFYEETALVADHNPGTTRQVSFASWRAGQPGTHAISCSTELLDDMQPADDKLNGAVVVYPPWYCATPSAHWSERYRHTAVEFDSKLWVFGGWDGSRRFNDVWYSDDGINWFLATAIAPWSARGNHATAVFDSKLWVLGGWDGNLKNDVWYSSDGISWELAIATAPWSARCNQTTITFNDRLWVLGGWDGSRRLNDVWYSSNGINWTCAANSAGWSGREDHASVMFDNKIWVIGGFGDIGYRNDVWCSSNGVDWTQITGSAGWSGRSGHAAVVFGSKLWVIGGWDAKLNNDVWYSSNGVNWNQATGSAGWSARRDHTAEVFNSKIWVFGGYDGSPKDDVWYWYYGK